MNLRQKTASSDRWKVSQVYKIFAAVLIVLSIPAAAFAQNTTVLFNPTTGWAAASNMSFGQNGQPVAYNPVYDPSTAANYIMSELGNNDMFGSLSHMTQGGTQKWTETTTPNGWATAAIFLQSGVYSVITSEDGATLPCTLSDGKTAAEYDYFLGPNNNDTGPNVVTAIGSSYNSNPKTFPSLMQLATLTLNGSLAVNTVAQTISPTSCNVNHISVGYNINLYNSVYKYNIAYQLHLGHMCLPGGDFNNCSSAPQNVAAWYKVQGVAAVTDTPSVFTSGLSIVPTGMSASSPPSPLTGTGAVNFTSVNLLTELVQIIAHNPYDLDTNPSDWIVTAVGGGTNLWGDSSIKISWGNLYVSATCVPAGC